MNQVEHFLWISPADSQIMFNLDENGRRTATEDSETMIPTQDFNKQNRDLRIFKILDELMTIS